MSIATIAASEASQAAAARKSLSQNFETFLTLLTAQLANQDPLQPLDSNEFTQQLVQYSQVEQQIQTNDSLKAMADQSRAAASTSALAYLGRNATIEASDLFLSKDSPARWSYELNGETKSARMLVLDSAGREVHSEDVVVRNGVQSFAWDGKMRNGALAPDGKYRLSIRALDGDNNAVPTRIMIDEKIIGVDMNADTPTVMTAAGARAFDLIRYVRQ
jgi:flagellar basal-body rod modification protein FlgD